MTDTYEKEISFTPTISKRQLREVCKMSIKDFESLGVVDESGNVFIDNGSSVLFVAHRDYVCSKVFCSFPTDDLIFSPQLDDRLGIYVGLYLLPQYGITPDILLTTNEEIGQSTAQDFKPSKKYNWMFQFDRHGDDVVTYQYSSKVWHTALIDAGFKVGNGTFSDICYLDHMGVCGVNVAVAYHNEHFINCYASVPMLFDQVDTFATFWSKNKNTEFPFNRHEHSRYTESRLVSPGYTVFRGYEHYDDPRDFDDFNVTISNLPSLLECEYCWKEYRDREDIRHIINTGMCRECDDVMSNIDNNVYGCAVCGSVMPAGDYKDGMCYNCYSQIVKGS